MEARRKGIRIDPSDLALEVVSIVIAILLALAVNRWQEGLAHERLLHESLLNVRREILANRSGLTDKMPLHSRVMVAFRQLTSDHERDENVSFGEVFRVFHQAAPRGFQPVKGDDIAWQIAQNSQAVSYMPYETRVALTRAYDEQAQLYGAEVKFSDAAFSASAASKDYYVQAFAAMLWLGDVTYDEAELLRRYDAALKLLPTS